MTNHAQHGGRRRSTIAVAASVLLAGIGAIVLFSGLRTVAGPPQPPTNAVRSLATYARTAAPAGTPAASASSPRKGSNLGPILNASPPVAIDIPSIRVSTRMLVDLGLITDGTLEAPRDFSSVGWYTAGPSPGELGAAVLTGHVDSYSGPAVFYRLGALRPGARVSITRKDGSTATFNIDQVLRFPKDRFPTALVYGSTSRAELRLITCGGSFDQKSGHYADNVVAFAHLIA